MPSALFNKSASPTLYLFTIIYYLLPTAEGSAGTPGGTRTPDLLLRRQLLYPAELLAHIHRSGIGAGDGNRTRVSSLEGWCSTIELHPQLRLTSGSAMKFYHERAGMSSLFFNAAPGFPGSFSELRPQQPLLRRDRPWETGPPEWRPRGQRQNLRPGA